MVHTKKKRELERQKYKLDEKNTVGYLKTSVFPYRLEHSYTIQKLVALVVVVVFFFFVS